MEKEASGPQIDLSRMKYFSIYLPPMAEAVTSIMLQKVISEVSNNALNLSLIPAMVLHLGSSNGTG